MIPRFRVWVNEIKAFFEPDDLLDIDYENKEITTQQVYFENSLPDDRDIYCYDFDEIVLMQSTGLKDYFDEELFEGDVIEWSYCDEFEDSGTAEIVFDKGMFKLLDVRTGEEVWDNLFDCIENCNVFLQGNIYENPELLEDKE